MLNNLKYQDGARKKSFKRCRGVGSGLGKNGGSGNKGQNSRSGGGVRLGFEGGQLPYFRRFQKRGFKHHAHIDYAIINLETLSSYKEGEVIDITKLIEDKKVSQNAKLLKVLGRGELKVKLTVKANKFSETAKEAITSIGGEALVVE